MTPADAPGCDEIRKSLGVYVLGAIDPAERSVVDRHLADCSACRDELSGLAGLPALLGRVTLEEAERSPQDRAAAAEPPERLLDSMLDELARRRKASRRRGVLTGVVAVAASVVVAVGAFAGVNALVSGPAAPQHHVAAGSAWDTESARDAATRVSAIVKYRGAPWGSQMSVWVAGVPTGTECELVVTDASGQHTRAGSWQALYRADDAWYPGSSAVAATSISSFAIISQGKTLITIPA
jgi:anti-sigma factor RsiW